MFNQFVNRSSAAEVVLVLLLTHSPPALIVRVVRKMANKDCFVLVLEMSPKNLGNCIIYCHFLLVGWYEYTLFQSSFQCKNCRIYTVSSISSNALSKVRTFFATVLDLTPNSAVVHRRLLGSFQILDFLQPNPVLNSVFENNSSRPQTWLPRSQESALRTFSARKVQQSVKTTMHCTALSSSEG